MPHACSEPDTPIFLKIWTQEKRVKTVEVKWRCLACTCRKARMGMGMGFEHIFLRPRLKKKVYSSQPYASINFPKIWAREKYVESFMAKYRY